MASSIRAFASPSAGAGSRTRTGHLPGRVLGNQAAAIGLAIVALYVALGLAADWLPLRNPLQIVGANRTARWGCSGLRQAK